MLTYLAVKNMAVIESASMEFGPGLNVITGETGAGKSVLVGALKFLTGERLNKTVLKDPEKKIFVEGIFSRPERFDKELARQYEIEDEIILSRESDESGKNKAFINGRAVPVAKLKDICLYLIDIHGQHEHQMLFDPSRHLSFIDFFVPPGVKENYAKAYGGYKAKADELGLLRKNIEDIKSRREIYEFQLEEINSMNIDPERDGKIEERIEFLSHIEKIKEAAALCMDVLKEGEVSASDLVGKAEKALSGAAALAPELTKAADCLRSAASYIDDAASFIESVFQDREYSPGELDSLIDRKFRLAALLKKYGPELTDVLARKADLEEKLGDVSFSGEALALLEKETDAAEKKALDAAILLNDAREKAGRDIALKTVEILKDLELAKSRFEVKFTDTGRLDAQGGASAEFFISTNPGFPLGPLASVASGGEISRVMLALKEVFAKADDIGTMVFDEIDTGISGRAAKSVAEKLKRLSSSKQIIVITHLPVVAAAGSSHFNITKSEVQGASRTDILKLEEGSRAPVIATMIAGSPTPAALAQAEELIKNSPEL